MSGMSATPLAPAPAVFPDAAASFALAGPTGKLEIAVDVPESAAARRGVAVISHPDPRQGGTLHNKVVTMLERALRESGLATVRYNFRGVGASEGAYDEGDGESDDLLAVAAWARAARPGDALWLAGFSFGSYVSLRCAPALAPAALITVAPPVGVRDFADITTPSCPWLLVQGEADEIVEAAAVFAWADALDPAPVVVRMADTGHFFHRRLLDLRGAVKHAVRGWLPPLRDRA